MSIKYENGLPYFTQIWSRDTHRLKLTLTVNSVYVYVYVIQLQISVKELLISIIINY